MNFRDPKDQGTFPFAFEEYGRSFDGVPLYYVPSSKKVELLVFAGIHGEEAETVFLLSRALRKLNSLPEHVASILCANPDGVLRGTRGNARGVDLNRNFPTRDWKSEKTLSRLVLEAPRVTELSSGAAPASEPETQALIALIDRLKPSAVIALHAPLGVVDSRIRSPLEKKLDAFFRLPWVPGIGYATPGSFGRYAAEHFLECITLELPREAPEILVSRYADAFAEFLVTF